MHLCDENREYRNFEINRDLRQIHPGVVAEVLNGISAADGAAVREPTKELETTNGDFTLSLVIIRRTRTPAGSPLRRAWFDFGRVPDISAVIRMDELDRKPFDNFPFPFLDIGAGELRFGFERACGVVFPPQRLSQPKRPGWHVSRDHPVERVVQSASCFVMTDIHL